MDGETFIFYYGLHKGGKKKAGNREEAICTCTDSYLNEYYKILEENWLKQCWMGMEKKINLPDWKYFRSESYLYFMDRARRFSILKNPLGLLLAHIKG